MSGVNSVDSSITSNGSKKKKKGLKKLAAKVFGGGKRRRKRKSGTDGESASYDSHSASEDVSTELQNPDGSANTKAQQEWIHGGADGLADMAAIGNGRRINRTNSAGGRGHSLTKIAEVPDEDNSSGDFTGDAAAYRRNSGEKRRGKRSQKHKEQSSDSSVGSQRSKGSFGFKRKSQAKADPLSLVVLLVEPSSLRFELLSLDFDLATTKKKWKRKKEGEEAPALQLTVQDVLDQITPSALTDEKLQKRVGTPGACQGMIDRKGTVHFGGASLETACASRPLRAIDTVNNDRGGKLGIPTYSGDPHRDVLLGFFGSSNTTTTEDGGGLSEATKQDVAKALELARPIFSDPNVIGLMESSGYNLIKWKPDSKLEALQTAPKLGKPLPPAHRKSKRFIDMATIKTGILVFLALVLSTGLAWSIVAGGLHLLPDERTEDPKTLEGHLANSYGHALVAYDSAKTWYYSNASAVE